MSNMLADDKAADAAWSRAVRERDRHTCQYCWPGCTRKGTEASHIFPRSFQKVRRDPMNGIAACRSCHDRSERNHALSIAFYKQIFDKVRNGFNRWKYLTDIMEKEYGRKY